MRRLAGLAGALLAGAALVYAGLQTADGIAEMRRAVRTIGAGTPAAELALSAERAAARLSATTLSPGDGRTGAAALAALIALRADLMDALGGRAFAVPPPPELMAALSEAAVAADPSIEAASRLRRGDASVAEALLADPAIAPERFATIAQRASEREIESRAAFELARGEASAALWIAGAAGGALLLLGLSGAIGRGGAAAGGARAPAAMQVQALGDDAINEPLRGLMTLLVELRRDADAPTEAIAVEAQAAARRLADLLGADAEPDEAAIALRDAASEPVALSALADSLRDSFGATAGAAGAEFRVACLGEGAAATRDSVRLRRALDQLCGYALRQTGVRDVSIELQQDNGEFRAALSFELPESGPALAALESVADGTAERPVAAGDAEHAAEEDVLGPLLAKGLLESIGGRLEVQTQDSGRVMVLAAAPTEDGDEAGEEDESEQAAPQLVRIMARSRSLGALGAAAANAAGVDVLDADSAPAPQIVLIETGGAEERDALMGARARWPFATLVALGETSHADKYDDVAASPLTPTSVAEAIGRARSKPIGGLPPLRAPSS